MIGTIALVVLSIAMFWLLLHNAHLSTHNVHYRPRR
jgi:hypothetical protein